MYGIFNKADAFSDLVELLWDGDVIMVSIWLSDFEINTEKDFVLKLG
jgi:hypothetical protein